MIAKVTEQGVVIPKTLLGDANEVSIVTEPGRVVVVFDPAADPIWGLGKNPVALDVTDASVNLDKYVYDNP